MATTPPTRMSCKTCMVLFATCPMHMTAISDHPLKLRMLSPHQTSLYGF